MENPVVFIVSGGSGASGDQLVQTALAQFPQNRFTVRIYSNVREIDQVDKALIAARQENAIVVHTLVNEAIYTYFVEKAAQLGVFHFDVMQCLLRKLSEISGMDPAGHPGLYRKLHKEYFDRVAAIEYTMAHDDGKHPEGWQAAEIVITGVSRVGKTPLSMYLSVLGWKVANVPLIFGLEPNPALFDIDRRCLIGLTMHPGQLIIHRKHRQIHLGVAGLSDYTDPQKVFQEVEFFDKLLRAKAIALLDNTDKPIETTADDVLKHVQR